MNNFTIYPASNDDLPYIAKLEQLFSSPWSLQSLSEHFALDNSLFYIAELNNSIVGYISAYYVADMAFINNIVVANSARRIGVATALINTLCDKLTNICAKTTVTLEVRASNAPAIALYNTLGFKTVGTRKNFYTKPTEHALILNKSLRNKE